MAQPPTGRPAFFGTKVSKPGVPVQVATDKQLVFKNDYTTTTWYDTANARIVEGKLPDGSYGMWVSKPGFDATDVGAATNGELVFNSNQDIFKIIKTGFTAPLTVSGVGGAGPDFGLVGFEILVPHNLGFNPLVFVTLASSTALSPLITPGVPLPFTNWLSFVQLFGPDGAGGTNTYKIPFPNFVVSVAAVTSSYFIIFAQVGQQSSTTLFNGDYVFKYYLLQETAV